MRVVEMTESPVGDLTAATVGTTAAEGDVRPDNSGPGRPTVGRIIGSLSILALVGLVIPLLVTHAYGAVGIVRNDDWSYLRTLFNWVDTGHLDFNNWVSMTLLSQLALAAPIVAGFGHNIALVQLETALFGFAGLCLVTWIGFAVTRRLWLATFIGVLVAAGPLWGALSVSFMTDVPAFAVSMLACALGVRALKAERVSLPYLVASMAVGLLGFTIRQYAAIPLIAITLMAGVLLWREGSKPRLRAFAITCVTLLIAAAAFWAFWRTIPHPKSFSPEMPSGHSVRAAVYKGTGMFRLVGLLVTPAIVIAGPMRILRRAWDTAHDTTLFVGGGVLAAMTFTATAAPTIAFAGNYIAPDGILAQGVATGHRPDIFPAGVFSFLLAIGTVASAFLALALVPLLHEIPRRWHARDVIPHNPVVGFLGLVVTGYGLAYFAAGITDIPLYDRYVLPVVPLIAVLLLRSTPAAAVAGAEDAPTPARPATRGGVIRGIAALAALGFVGYVYLADAAAFDGTRWKVAAAATDAGWTRHQIRGGFEWTNFYAGTRVPQSVPYCVRVVVNPPDGLAMPRVIAHAYYRSPLRPAVLVVAQRTRIPCTPARVKLRAR